MSIEELDGWLEKGTVLQATLLQEYEAKKAFLKSETEQLAARLVKLNQIRAALNMPPHDPPPAFKVVHQQAGQRPPKDEATLAPPPPGDIVQATPRGPRRPRAERPVRNNNDFNRDSPAELNKAGDDGFGADER